MAWIQDLVEPKSRKWEEFYRNRWQHDNIVRSTHGVNCTGSCSWQIYVKDGIITWEMQNTDYVLLKDVPPYEPRGCQRGISASWYVYSPIRVKYPYARGVLLDFWREARKKSKTAVEAWASIMEDDAKRTRIQKARGKGGFRRTSWDEASEIAVAAMLYTAKKYGTDRIIGFSPIPAMSYLSYAGGSRFLQLFGAVNMSFYDWYADLPNAFPEIWGDQTDVAESADWFNSKYIVSYGANMSMTRTPDVHFLAEARHNGTKYVSVAPDFSMVTHYADWWIPVKPGTDTAMWMAVNHVILKEFFADRQVPYFINYLKQYSDCPFIVELEKDGDTYKAGRLLRANRVSRYKDEENGDWKMLVFDKISGQTRMPKGTTGFRWSKTHGNWNLKLEDGKDNSTIDPELTFLDKHDEVLKVQYHEFAESKVYLRGIPVRYVETATGKVPVTTVFDLMIAQFGVGRGLPGDFPKSYDEIAPYTPAWQEQYTGIGRETITRLAREFAHNAEATNGKTSIIVGASINHWYNNSLMYRAPINALMLCGCCGVNGGGMNHYVGQEKLALVAPWVSVAMALDWIKPSRRQQAPFWHYMNSDQWRYEGDFTDYAPVPTKTKWAKGHAADLAAMSVRMGWMPHYPQFNLNPFDIVKKADSEGAKSDAEVVSKVVEQLKDGRLNYAVDDPDAPENWPRMWIMWRGNAFASSAKGSEFFLRHYLGTHDNIIAEEHAKGKTKTVKFREPAPRGKFDLVVDLNFRMDSSALYSDIVLPSAFWYEKNDLNTTDLHSFIHPLGAAVPPVWEAKSDWEIFKLLARKVSDMSKDVFSGPMRDITMWPLMHDTADEMAQTEVKDWRAGECEPIPGKTMSNLKVVTRDYANLYNQFISLGPNVRSDGINGNGVQIPMEKFYDELLEKPSGGSTPDSRKTRCVEWSGNKYPSLEDALDTANVILHLAPETNGEVAYEAFLAEEHHTGVPLAEKLAAGTRGVNVTYHDLTRQVRRLINSPCWTGLVDNGRAYSAWCLNVDYLVPWRTLTGRQHFYLDHQYYLDFGEHLPTFKPKLDPRKTGDIVKSTVDAKSLVLNYITPHGKWNIHSTYKDNHRMLTLSRGMDPVWINQHDAEKVGIVDNDWVEMYNDNGVIVTRANVSARVQPGMCLYYHAVERTIYIPKSQERGKKRAGGHNSVTRTRINPLLLAGGYAQFTWQFNYWGPIGIFTRDTYVVVKKMEVLEW